MASASPRSSTSPPYYDLSGEADPRYRSVTVEGTGMGFLPIRDIAGYQTSATTSPPTPAARASWPVMTPCEVDRIVVPIPPSTLGIDFEST